ncbi:NUDIX domain-containing protein [Streptomyces lydicus]|uniref:NUDIX domain-containing protein n=1 Tax=Streptomyces lydicus TaxID=47763 RepID=UPI0036EB31C9
MTRSHAFPAPRLRRVVHLLAFDATGHLLLRRSGHAEWAYPSLHVQLGETYEDAARRLLRTTRTEFVKPGEVSGRHWATPTGPARYERRFQIVHVRRATSEADPHQKWVLPSCVPLTGRWSDELRRLAEGYRGGWLPEGPIRLDWD